MTTAIIILTVVTFSYMFYDLFTRKTWMDEVLEKMEIK